MVQKCFHVFLPDTFRKQNKGLTFASFTRQFRNTKELDVYNAYGSLLGRPLTFGTGSASLRPYHVISTNQIDTGSLS